MPFENLKENAEEIQEKLKDVVDSNVAYYKLWLFKITAKSSIALFKIVLMAVFFLMGLLFTSIALALFLGQQWESYPLGLLAVGGIYLVLILVVYLVKDKIVERTILKKLSNIFFND
ncbi:phage holin family protein [Flavobacterium pedocola]